MKSNKIYRDQMKSNGNHEIYRDQMKSNGNHEIYHDQMETIAIKRKRLRSNGNDCDQTETIDFYLLQYKPLSYLFSFANLSVTPRRFPHFALILRESGILKSFCEYKKFINAQ
jgi:hypothetical protein